MNKQEYRAAKAIIEKPENWTKGSFARSATGGAVPTDDPEAVCFCALGACLKSSPKGPFSDNLQELIQAATELGSNESDEASLRGITWINDNSGHEAVMKMFDRAIELAKESP